MYLRTLHVHNIRLLASQELSFSRPGGKPRMWTVLLGDNGTCKTSILQCIALAALGEKLALSAEFVPAWLIRQGAAQAAFRVDGVLPDHAAQSPRPYFGSGTIWADASRNVLWDSGDERGEQLAVRDPFFLAGYGAHRILPQPGESFSPPSYPEFDRVKGLFNRRHRMLATDFYQQLRSRSTALARDFTRVLDTALQATLGDERLLPRLVGIERRGAGGVQESERLLFERKFKFSVADNELKLEAFNLSEGYQSMIGWIADLIGHYALREGRVVAPGEMTGLVLLDEIDLHLHPTWQGRIVPILKQTFPKLQFVVTTHSPLVLTGFEPEEIMRLEFDRDGLVRVHHDELRPATATTAEILASYFDVGRALRPTVAKLVDELNDLLGFDEPTPAQKARMVAIEQEIRDELGEAPS